MTQLIDLGKLRFHFAGDWSSSTTYESNDIVKYGGNVYVYTHALKTAGNLPTNSTYWALMVEGFKFKGVFDVAVAYRVGDGIAHGGKVYVCVLDCTGQTPPNTTYWSQFADGIQYEGTYSNVKAYQKNDVVIYGGSIYIAKVDTTANDPTNGTYWDKFVEGVAAKGVYNGATAYVPGDLAAYGPNIYRAKANSTGNLPTNTSFWELFISGSLWRGAYDGAVTYYLNDIVLYGANAYRSKSTQSAVLPTEAASWELVSTGFSFQGVWSSATNYKIGQTVSYGGSLFQAKADNNNVNPTTTATWDKLVAGFKNRGDWATATQYGIDEVVTFGGNTYISLLPHASTVFETDLAANKWQKFNSGVRWAGTWTTATAYLKDDIVKNGVSTYIVTASHTAGTFATDLAAGKLTEFAKGGDYVLPSLTGQAGKVLGTDGSGYLWVSAGGTWVNQSANYTAASGDKILADTTAATFTVTLPASPVYGDFVYIVDSAGKFSSNKLVVARNGNKIMGLSEDLDADMQNASFGLVYHGATQGWRIY